MADIDEETLHELAHGTLIARMGIIVDHAAPDLATGSMPVDGNTQPYGLLHGGASAALAETLASFAAMAHAQPDGIAVGVDLSVTHHRAMRSGTVRGTATALHRGRTIATYDVRIEDESGHLVATARLTCAIRPRPET